MSTIKNKNTNKKTEGKRTILAVGFASFFGGVSQDIFLPILPLYLTQTLGFDKALVGVAEGLVTAASSVFKVVAGRLSDKYRRQKPIVIAGYGLSMVGRGALAFVQAPLAILGLRFLDGTGKGAKDPPKDVLVANAAQKTTRGRSFGVARMLDTFGSAVGPLALSGLIFLFTKHNIPSSQYYRWLMVLSALILLITIAIVKFGIREVKKPQVARSARKAPPAKSFYVFTIIAGVFALANSSDAFLILRSQNLGLSVIAIPLVYAVLNIVYGALALPAGILSDKVGRIPMITIGWAVYGLSYLGFALAHSAWQVWVLFAFYGVFYATSEGVGRALIADMVGSDSRGSAYGLFNMTIGLLTLPASLIAGLLWDNIGPSAPFFFGALLSLLAVILIVSMRKQLVPASP